MSRPQQNEKKAVAEPPYALFDVPGLSPQELENAKSSTKV